MSHSDLYRDQWRIKNNKMNIKFISQKEAEKIDITGYEDDMAIISITQTDEARLHKNWKFRLNLCFDDVDKEGSFKIITKDGTIDIPYLLFNEDMARRIIYFSEGLPKTIETIIVHCFAGISRSSAVTKFLAERYRAIFPNNYMLYNKLVYRVLCDTMNKMMKENEGKK